MSYGIVVRANDGTLLMSSDTPCYKYFNAVNPVSRSGNVNTYTVNTSDRPLCFVQLPYDGARGGIISIQGGPGGWTVEALCDSNQPLYVFQTMTGVATGYGAAVYSSSGKLVFDASQPLLNAKGVGSVTVGSTVGSQASNLVSYTSGAVRANSSSSTYNRYIGSYSYFTFDCQQVPQVVCQQYQNCYLQYDSFSGSFYQVCYPYTQCFTQFVTVCQNNLNIVDVVANITETNWTLDRSVLVRNSGGTSYTVDWLLHKSGQYRVVNQYYSVVNTLLQPGTPPGYTVTPSMVFPSNYPQATGEITASNQYPYSQSVNNDVPLPCITALGSDYV